MGRLIYEVNLLLLGSGFIFWLKCDIMVAMRLPRKIDRMMLLLTVFLVTFTMAAMVSNGVKRTFAESEKGVYVVSAEHFVTFFDEGERLTVRTDARTVGEAVARAGIALADQDIVEPVRETVINGDNFFINVHRARPVVVKSGLFEKYLMTASYDAKTIVTEAGLTVYDGDEIELVPSTNFLEAGVTTVYRLTRNGGHEVTEEVEIPYAEEEVRDVTLESGKREVRQLGEVGLKRVLYTVQYVDGAEVSREVVSETVVREPVARVVAVGAKKSVPPEAATCAGWARAAGVSEADLALAIDLIYHESGCRVDARNARSGAYGIPQALPGSKMATYGADWETNPVTQIKWMAAYVKGRYGGWAEAVDWWYKHGWY